MITLEDIAKNYDNPSFTIEEAAEAAKEIFSVQEQDFESIKNRPWYNKLLNGITLGSLDKKKIVNDIRSLSTLQSIFLVIYSKCYTEQSEVIEQIIDEQKKSNNRLAKIYTKYIVGINPQDELESIKSKEAKEVLLSILAEYCSLNSHGYELEEYRRNIAKRLNVMLPDNSFNPEQLDIARDYHHIFYRCIMEMCALDALLTESPSLPDKISETIDYLYLPSVKLKDIKNNVIKEMNAFGADYFLCKYDLQDEAENIEKDIELDEVEDEKEPEKSTVEEISDTTPEPEKFDASELTDEYITTILHIAPGETKIFEKKNIHLKAFINCEGKLVIKNSVLFYNENGAADEITMTGGTELTITNSIIICKGFDEKSFITLGSDSVAHISNCTFIDCSYFIYGSYCKKFIMTKCELNNCFIHFAEISINEPDNCIISYNRIFQEKLNSYYLNAYNDNKYGFSGNLFDLNEAKFLENSITVNKTFLTPFENSEKTIGDLCYLYSYYASVYNCSFNGISSRIHANRFIENKFTDCVSCIAVKSWYSNSKPIIKDCVFERCTDIIQVQESDTVISYCQFISCYGRLIFPYFCENFNVEFCQFVNITNNLKPSNAYNSLNPCILFRRGKATTSKKSIVKKCIFDTVQLGESFLIAPEAFCRGKPYGCVVEVRDCTFSNCHTKRTSGVIIKHYITYDTLFKKSQSFDGVYEHDCTGLDKINKENPIFNEPIINNTSSVGNRIGSAIAVGTVAAIVGGPVVGAITGVATKKLFNIKSQESE